MMKHKVYKAVDNLDNKPSYFYLDYENNKAIIITQTSDYTDDEVVEYFKKYDACWNLKPDTESRMSNPVLIAEW